MRSTRSWGHGYRVLTRRHPAETKVAAVYPDCSIVRHTGSKVLIEEGNRSEHDAVYYFVD